jgi:alkanesulfonate monooxygenase SsuD/methylene tetrahydromethanopterin reductase-like flavin-dependent oxidoreductase (luciferase family)
VLWTGSKGWYLFTARETEEVIASRLKLYTEALAAAGYEDEFISERLDWSLVQKQVIVGETDAEAIEFARERITETAAHQKKNFTITGDIKDSNQLKSVLMAGIAGLTETVGALLVGAGMATVLGVAMLAGLLTNVITLHVANGLTPASTASSRN